MLCWHYFHIFLSSLVTSHHHNSERNNNVQIAFNEMDACTRFTSRVSCTFVIFGDHLLCIQRPSFKTSSGKGKGKVVPVLN
jgi:hypothetical protein